MNQKPLHGRPRYVAFAATSLDGRISLTTTSLPRWTSKEDRQFFQKSLLQFDAVVVGRSTYLSAASRLRRRRTFVLSRRPRTTTRRGTVTFVNPARADLATLLANYKKVAVLGGGAVYRYMLEEGLVDELFVTVEPLIFGRGTEMCTGGTKTMQLHLLSTRRLNSSGSLLLHYKVVRKRP